MKNLINLSLAVAIFITLSIDGVFAQDLENQPVEKFANRGETGSFGTALSKYPTLININGYITNEFFYREDGQTYFDNHYFNTFIGAQLNDKLSAEIQFEYEHAGNDIGARYAQLDYKITDGLIIRTGKFLMPAGDFNEYLYPEFIHKSISRPWAEREIVPSAWAEVGIQLRGKFEAGRYGNIFNPYYAVYAVNGLQGDQGSGIRSLRNNSHSGNNDSYGYGGSFGAEIGNYFNIYSHLYNGKYTETEDFSLMIAGGGLSYDNDAFSFYGAYHIANQEVYASDSSTVTLNKSGFYGQLAYKIAKKIEPLVRYDAIALDGSPEGDRTRITIGLNYYIRKNANIKFNYELISNDGVDAEDNLIGAQISIGF